MIAKRKAHRTTRVAVVEPSAGFGHDVVGYLKQLDDIIQQTVER